jgi:hypothetical protein
LMSSIEIKEKPPRIASRRLGDTLDVDGQFILRLLELGHDEEVRPSFVLSSEPLSNA